MIPDEAVEAAAEAVDAFTEEFYASAVGFNDRDALINRILKAAAPFMLAAAWDEAFGKGRDRGDWEAAPVRAEPEYTNPYRSTDGSETE